MPILNHGGKTFSQNNKTLTTPWKPSKINGLIFWGDSNPINISANSNRISTWLDSSGKMNNGIQTTSSKKPYYIKDVINGHSAILFQNINNLSIKININVFTIFTVIKSINNNYVYEFGSSTENTTGFYLNGNTNAMAVSVSGISNCTIKKQNVNWLSSGSTEWKIITHQYNGTHSSHNLFINSNMIFLPTYLNYNNNPGEINKMSNLILGSKGDDTFGLNAYITEYLIFDTYLEYEDILKINNYLNNKYSIY